MNTRRAVICSAAGLAAALLVRRATADDCLHVVEQPASRGEIAELLLRWGAWPQSLSPRVSLIARDWEGARPLLGHLALTDQIRLSRLNRMLVTRVLIGEGWIAPFAQAGVGQWRLDTELMPAVPHDAMLAGQFGAGFELALGNGAAAALEADYTAVYEMRPDAVPAARRRPWTALLGVREVF